MKFAIISNKSFSMNWFVLTYDTDTKQFNKTLINSVEDIGKLLSDRYRKVYIRTTRALVKGNKTLINLYSFKSMVYGYCLGKGYDTEQVDADLFKEFRSIQGVKKDMEYKHVCALFLLDKANKLNFKLVTKKRFGKDHTVKVKPKEDHPLKKHIDKIKDEDIL